MASVLNEIRTLRNNKELRIDHKNSNRYCIVSDESDGSKTMYAFSVPIYNDKTKRILDRRFHYANGLYYVYGSNATVSIDKDIISMENANGLCRISLSGNIISASEDRICYETVEIAPTLNGLIFKAPYKPGCTHNFSFESGKTFLHIQENDKYFAFMSGTYLPFASVSCIGVFDDNNTVVAPCNISSCKIKDYIYILSISSDTKQGKHIMFEINMYEHKLFQDTTVEQRKIHANNVFGGTAFIGFTPEYGEQQLYTKPDFGIIPEIYDSRIYKAILHIPQYHKKHNTILTAYKIESNFCSFGSNWDNKKLMTEKVSDGNSDVNYQHFNVKDLISYTDTNLFKDSFGLVIKADKGFAAVSTGDSHYLPQILELGF